MNRCLTIFLLLTIIRGYDQWLMPGQEWCARVFTDNNYHGQRQEVPETVDLELAFIYRGMFSVKLNTNCSVILMGDDSAARVDFDNPNFNIIDGVLWAQCSCFRSPPGIELNGWDCETPGFLVNQIPGERCDPVKKLPLVWTNTAGIARIQYVPTNGLMYFQNCIWQLTSGGLLNKWECI